MVVNKQWMYGTVEQGVAGVPGINIFSFATLGQFSPTFTQSAPTTATTK
jgi:hypothetical protein